MVSIRKLSDDDMTWSVDCQAVTTWQRHVEWHLSHFALWRKTFIVRRSGFLKTENQAESICVWELLPPSQSAYAAQCGLTAYFYF